ncbi:MAG: L-threonylcarbamoyladenylate synthase [Leptonema sp. (in: bacteria)]
MFVTAKKAVELLLQGNIVILPTETVYGLAGLATKPSAIEKIYKVKKRPKENPLICHVGDIRTIYEYSYVNAEEEKLLSFFPGPLTVLIRKRNIPDIVTAGSEFCAFRMPTHKIFLEIANKVTVPIAAPSANPSGRISPTSEEIAYEYFGETIDIVKGGKCEIGIESTVVRVIKKNTLEILRAGFFTKEFFVNQGFTIVESKKENDFLSPGLLPKHYSPSIPLILFSQNYMEYLKNENYKEKLITILENVYEPIKKQNLRCKKIGFLIYGEEFKKNSIFYNLSKSSNLQEIAKNLFLYLKEMEKNFDVIFAFKPPIKEGLGVAIIDRLRRASEFEI